MTDPDAEAYLRSLATDRRAGLAHLVRRLEQIGYLRADVALDRGGDIVFALFSHETNLAAQAFVASEDLRSAMRAAGVQGEPSI